MSGARRGWGNMALWLGPLGPFVGLVFVWLLFAALSWKTFATLDNTQIMLLQTSVVGTAAIGATLVIIAGGIDLSVGSVIALSTVLTALCLGVRSGQGVDQVMVAEQWPVLWPIVAALAGILGAALCGLAAGMMVVGRIGRVVALGLGGLVAYWCRGLGWPAALGAGLVVSAVLWVIDRYAWRRVPLVPFIVTLGLLGLLRGLAEGLANQQMVRAPRTWLNSLLSVSAGDTGMWLPPGVLLMLVLALLTAGLLRYTRFGRYVFAIGSNEETARLCGIPVERMKLWIYGLGIAFAGIAGILQFSYLRMGDPTTAPGYELNVIAAVVIGGGSLSGGQGAILGSLIGALIMTVVANGCNKLGLDPWVQKMVTGAIIVAAVTLDQVRRRSR